MMSAVTGTRHLIQEASRPFGREVFVLGGAWQVSAPCGDGLRSPTRFCRERGEGREQKKGDDMRPCRPPCRAEENRDVRI